MCVGGVPSMPGRGSKVGVAWRLVALAGARTWKLWSGLRTSTPCKAAQQRPIHAMQLLGSAHHHASVRRKPLEGDRNLAQRRPSQYNAFRQLGSSAAQVQLSGTAVGHT